MPIPASLTIPSPSSQKFIEPALLRHDREDFSKPHSSLLLWESQDASSRLWSPGTGTVTALESIRASHLPPCTRPFSFVCFLTSPHGPMSGMPRDCSAWSCTHRLCVRSPKLPNQDHLVSSTDVLRSQENAVSKGLSLLLCQPAPCPVQTQLWEVGHPAFPESLLPAHQTRLLSCL